MCVSSSTTMSCPSSCSIVPCPFLRSCSLSSCICSFRRNTTVRSTAQQIRRKVDIRLRLFFNGKRR
ncbi:unnamed protein product [Strongylus vulgaris]|uniref:Uncharacterized protein n=1 Tax=Strongylus vulgaris TaxID=40348 RepID=A0A3P7J8E5_STRVU|nr:unnamed protein product [Strongylus vulgaris]